MRFPLLSYPLYLAVWTLTVLQISGLSNDPGVGWHLLNGQEIAVSWSVPRFDHFLATAEHRPWIADQWFSDCLFAILFTRDGLGDGMPLLYGVVTSSFIVTFMGVLFYTSFYLTRSPFLSAIASVIALKLSTIHFILRPVVFGIALFAVAAFIIARAAHRFRAGESVRARDVIGLIPLTVLWANVHPSFGLGMILLGITFAGLLIDSVVIDQRPVEWRSFGLFGGTLLMMGCAALVNPYGFGLLKQVFSLVSDDFFMNLNEEWKPIKIRSGEGQLFLQSLVVILAGFFCSATKRKRWYVTEPLVLGFFASVTLSSVRFLPFYAIVSAPFLAFGIAAVFSWEPLLRLPPYARVLGMLRKIDEREKKALPVYFLFLGAASLFPLIDAACYGRIYPFTGPFEQSRKLFPYEGVAALHSIVKEEGLTSPVAVAASPNWGGFIAFHGKGQIKPVIDDRNSLLGVAAYKDYLANLSIGGDVAGYLQRTGARFLLLGVTDPLAVYLKDTGKLKERWRGSDSALFEALS